MQQQQANLEKQTPFFSEHIKLGARMCPFAGWSMPLHYGSSIKEHESVRESAGLFDVSHMAIVDVKGSQAKAFLRMALANDVAKIYPGKALYGCMLSLDGGIIDDLITYQIDEDHYRIIINAATTTKDIRHLETLTRGYDVALDLKSDFGLIACQGPKAVAILSELFPNEALTQVKPFHTCQSQRLMFARTGYTGEDGFEIMGPSDALIEVWQDLIAKGVTPCGLSARDSLRLEAGLNLYGIDMDETTSPLESNLAWTVDFKDEERDFVGKEALVAQKEQGIARQLIGLSLQAKGVLRGGMSVRFDGGEGVITSGGFAPSLGHSIAFARLPSTEVSEFEVLIRNQWVRAERTKVPFLKK